MVDLTIDSIPSWSKSKSTGLVMTSVFVRLGGDESAWPEETK
jgi:hypothetical protein